VDGVARLRRAGPNTVRCARSRSVFSTVDPHALFYANNVLWKTLDGGINWKQISPDLTRETWDVPKSVGTYADACSARARRDPAQVIYTIGRRIATSTGSGSAPTTA
jgi:hypothetical protein